MQMTAEKLKELLVTPGFITSDDFSHAEKEAADHNTPIDELLIGKDLIKDEQLGQLIAEELGFQFMNLRKERIDDTVFHLVPELVARSRGVVAFARGSEGVKIGMTDPSDLEMRHFLEKRLGEKVQPYFITRRDLEESLTRYKGTINEVFGGLLAKLNDHALGRDERDQLNIQIVDTLLQYGHQNKASDIHVEPYRETIRVRFRIDGIMHDVVDAPKSIFEGIVTRIKILSGMRTDEHRAAQDGKMQFQSKDEVVDVRVSIVPVTNGENVVMRLLSAKSRQFSLIDLGLGERDLEKVKKAIQNPHGMVLVTGPTGSGKTTTVYAILKILNTREVHISTIEDPVEYDIEGISQIQVNTRTELTFAKGLRAIVRQDPDIIMVGEIRDEETANIAVNSAMTGHLVLSTLHANDAATTLPRLFDMGVEPFLVASTVNVAIAQRLVRKICERCRASHTMTEAEKNLIDGNAHLKAMLDTHASTDSASLRLYQGAGCNVCGNTGYQGRIGIFEVLLMDDSIKDLVVKRAPSSEIVKIAREHGMSTMLEDGFEKVLGGVTTLEEVLRATLE